jgi:hypothetical protein
MMIDKVRHVVPPILVIREPEPGFALTDQRREDAYAARLAAQAESWYRFASERSQMPEEVGRRKAFDSLAFSLWHRANSLAVPTKLVGTRRYQKALRSLIRSQAGFGLRLKIEERSGQLWALYEGAVLGRIPV